MATIKGMRQTEIYTRGGDWFAFWLKASDQRDVAAKALNPRGYGFGVKPAKPGDVSQHDAGTALFAALGQKQSGRASKKLTGVAEGSVENDKEVALRTWLRNMHKEIVGIRRDEHGDVLKHLPTLGEVTTISGLENSTLAVIDFLNNPNAQAALTTYGIGKADAAEGQKLYGAWKDARGTAKTGRATTGAASADTRAAREAFNAWLNKWWGIAAVRLADHPEILTALGVGTKKRAGGHGGGGGTSGNGAGI